MFSCVREGVCGPGRSTATGDTASVEEKTIGGYDMCVCV